MNRKAAVKRMAEEAKKSLAKGSGVGISVYNYGLKITPGLLTELREMSGADSVSADGFMGYVHFSKKESK